MTCVYTNILGFCSNNNTNTKTGLTATLCATIEKLHNRQHTTLHR